VTPGLWPLCYTPPKLDMKSYGIDMKKPLIKTEYTVQLCPLGEEIYKAMKQHGFLDDNMITLAGPLDGSEVSSEWFRDRFHEHCERHLRDRASWPQYEMVMNRGYSGFGKWSSHVVWKNVTPDLQYVLDDWNDRYGSLRAVLSPHSEGLRYYVKNMLEPDARTHAGVYNRRNTPKKGKGFRGMTDE
jgi:hypothetical protein